MADSTQVLQHTQNTPHCAVVHDDLSGDTLLFAGITKKELSHASRDFAFIDTGRDRSRPWGERAAAPRGCGATCRSGVDRDRPSCSHEPMCGRFSQRYTWAEVHAFLSVIGAPLNLRPRYNIAPTTEIDVVRLNGDGRRELVRMRWGLVPVWWSKGLKDVPATFNARAETVGQKPMFRDAFRKRRCIIPASGFFEWTGKPGSKVPHLFTAADGSPILAFAGLWDRWKDSSGDEILSATIVVSGASDWMTPYHDRMPVLLRPEQFQAWLSGAGGPDILRPAPEEALREWTVSSRVNRTGVGDDDPSLLDPAEVA